MTRTLSLKSASRLLALASLWLGISYQANALTASEFYEKVSPSVWKVVTYDQDGLRFATGSAVVIAPEKLITNCHVLRKAKRFIVEQGNTAHGAVLEYLDLPRDLCQIKVKDLDAPAVAVANTKDVKVGAPVFTLGNPKGLELTLGSGLVSALRRDANDHIAWIQTSAPVSSGSSGGGLFDTQGRLIGITSLMVAGIDAQNLSFAIPAEWIAEVPEHSVAALKAEQESRAAKENAALKNARNEISDPNGRQVKGTELNRLFRNLGTISAQTSSGSLLRLTIRTNGSMNVSNVMTSNFTAGSYEIHTDTSQICLSMQNQNFSIMNGCYQMYQTSEGQFAVRSVSDGYFFTYKTRR